jgi:peptidoglycan biosynthesis protein MviN/MurJ (putative lipid II flippase)
VNSAVNIPLFAWLGVRGLAYGHAIAYATGTVLFLGVLARRVPGGLHVAAFVPELARIALVAGAMGACVWGIARAVPGGDLAVVAAAVSAGAILYLAFSQVARVEERAVVLGVLRRITRGGRARQ